MVIAINALLLLRQVFRVLPAAAAAPCRQSFFIGDARVPPEERGPGRHPQRHSLRAQRAHQLSIGMRSSRQQLCWAWFLLSIALAVITTARAAWSAEGAPFWSAMPPSPTSYSLAPAGFTPVAWPSYVPLSWLCEPLCKIAPAAAMQSRPVPGVQKLLGRRAKHQLWCMGLIPFR